MGGEREAELERELTKLRLRYAELAAEAALSNAAFDAALDAIVITDGSGLIVRANAACASLYARPLPELVGRRAGNFAAPEVDVEGLRRRFLETGALRSSFEIVRADGSRRVVESTAAALSGGLHISVLRDITDYEAATAALRRSDERFEKVFRSSPVPIAITQAADNRFLEVNEAYARLVGRPREALVGKTPHEAGTSMVTPEELAAHLRRFSEQGKLRDFAGRIERPSGELRDVVVAFEAIELAGHPCRLAVFHDVTEAERARAALKKAEEQLQQSQKMEAIGSLAGGIAHDFNNLLSIILGYVDLILEELSSSEAIRTDLEEVRSAAARAAELTAQLLAFSRRQVLEPRRVDLNQLTRGVEKLLRRLLGESVELAVQLAPHLGAVLIDPGRFEQILLNLAANARDALPRGGRLFLETDNVEIDAAQAALHEGVTPGSFVMLAVTDNGVGMDAETRARIFEPFFTTKERGKGTGLGLATVFGIVRQSGGYIWVYSEPSHGTTFRLYFPRVDGAIDAPSEAPAARTLRGRETILLVEDDPGVRAMVESILKRQGYRVFDAAGPLEAIAFCERDPTPIDLLLTDVVMPKMDGRALSERLLGLKPAMRVLFMSGYTDDAIVHHGVLDPGVCFIQKPITPDALARRIRQVLDGADSQRRPPRL